MLSIHVLRKQTYYVKVNSTFCFDLSLLPLLGRNEPYSAVGGVEERLGNIRTCNQAKPHAEALVKNQFVRRSYLGIN